MRKERTRTMAGTEARREVGEDGPKVKRGQKGRLLQERDRWGLAWVGMNRVVRERSLREVLFPGRDEATFANRVWELSRELEPVGSYWRVHRRVLDDGGVERYLALTDIGYRQAEFVLAPGWFPRRPVESLKPSHVVHDLELADFALSLVPRRRETYQPKAKGKPVGSPVVIEVPELPQKWRWYHASVFRRLTVLEGKQNELGLFTKRPTVALAYEPDAVLETDAFNCTRYFIEYDRGTEAIAGSKETRTILDKLRRLRAFFWEPRGGSPRPHWTQRRSYYLQAFAGDELRRPKCLFITTSPTRADNIWRLALHYFRDLFTEDQLGTFFEVLPLEAARRKLRTVTARAEARPTPPEMPWTVELREQATIAAEARAERAAEAVNADVERARNDPLHVPYRCFPPGTPEPAPYTLPVEEGAALLAWMDATSDTLTRVQQRPPRTAYGVNKTSEDVVARIRRSIAPTIRERLGNAISGPPAPVRLTLDDALMLTRWAHEALELLARAHQHLPGDTGAAVRVCVRLAFYFGVNPQHIPRVVILGKGAWADEDPENPWTTARAR
jgi:hypothetical protein